MALGHLHIKFELHICTHPLKLNNFFLLTPLVKSINFLSHTASHNRKLLMYHVKQQKIKTVCLYYVCMREKEIELRYGYRNIALVEEWYIIFDYLEKLKASRGARARSKNNLKLLVSRFTEMRLTIIVLNSAKIEVISNYTRSLTLFFLLFWSLVCVVVYSLVSSCK